MWVQRMDNAMKTLSFAIGTVFMAIGVVILGQTSTITEILGLMITVFAQKVLGVTFASAGFILWVFAFWPQERKRYNKG